MHKSLTYSYANKYCRVKHLQVFTWKFIWLPLEYNKSISTPFTKSNFQLAINAPFHQLQPKLLRPKLSLYCCCASCMMKLLFCLDVGAKVEVLYAYEISLGAQQGSITALRKKDFWLYASLTRHQKNNVVANKQQSWMQQTRMKHKSRNYWVKTFECSSTSGLQRCDSSGWWVYRSTFLPHAWFHFQ